MKELETTFSEAFADVNGRISTLLDYDRQEAKKSADCLLEQGAFKDAQYYYGMAAAFEKALELVEAEAERVEREEKAGTPRYKKEEKMKDYKALQDKIEKAYEYAFDFAVENSIPITADYLAKNVLDHLSTFNLVISPKDIAKKIVKVHDYGFANHIALTPEYIAGELAKDLLDEWSMTCDRCKGKCKSLKMSWLNTQMLCESCQKKEESHPLYKEAKKRELEEVKKGNYNYPGILG